MKEDASSQDESIYSERSSKSPFLIIIFFTVLVLVIVAAGGLYYLNIQNKQSSPPISPMPQPTISITPTSSISATSVELKRSDLVISVLNGSGTSGAARGISSLLTNLGYTVKTVGNADGFAYRDITIKIKKSKEPYLPMLKKDLEEDASVSSISASVVDTIINDAEVIVGR